MAQTEPRIIIVFAATGGIGSAVCTRLRASDVKLHVTGRDTEKLEKLAREWGATPWVADVTSPDEIDDTVKQVTSLEGRVDGVVQCAGSLLLKPAHATSEEEWHRTLRVNLDSAFFTVKSATRPMMKRGGSIVLLASSAARTGLVNHDAIAAAKAGVAGLTRSAAATYAARGIRVNCVAPGMVRTPLTQSILSNPTTRAASESQHPLGRVGEPSEVASAIEWLLSPEQSWVTGQIFGIDGGLATLRGRVRV